MRTSATPANLVRCRGSAETETGGMSEPRLIATYEQSEDDVIALQKRAMRTSSLIRDVRRKNIGNFLIAWPTVVGGFAGAGYALAPTHAAGMKVAALWIGFYIIIAAGFYRQRLTPRAAFRKLDEFVERGVRSGKIPVTRGPVEVSVQNDDVVVVESDSTLSRSLSAVVDVAQEEGDIYLTFSDGVLLRVPSRAFVDAAHRQAFMDASLRHITGKPQVSCAASRSPDTAG
jgi:hypothetical protein